MPSLQVSKQKGLMPVVQVDAVPGVATATIDIADLVDAMVAHVGNPTTLVRKSTLREKLLEAANDIIRHMKLQILKDERFTSRQLDISNAERD